MEKRRTKRFARRLTVRYGAAELTHSGITYDVSTTGAFIVGSFLPPLDSRIHLHLATRGGNGVYLEAEVRRHRVVPAPLKQVEKGGFGVRFLLPGELLADVLPAVPETSLSIAFDGPEALRRGIEQEIRFGGVFVHTERAFARDAAVDVEFRIEFASRRLEFPAHVVQMMAASVHGVAVAFDDPGGVLKALTAFLA